MPRKRHRTTHIGRVRIEAAKLLAAGLGFDVNPENITPVTGFWKSVDCHRWELFVVREGKHPFFVGCWESLTEFVRYAKAIGFHVKNKEICEGPGGNNHVRAN